MSCPCGRPHQPMPSKVLKKGNDVLWYSAVYAQRMLDDLRDSFTEDPEDWTEEQVTKIKNLQMSVDFARAVYDKSVE